MQLSEQDLALIQKYNQPGPRYTSYPPANHFAAEIDSESLLVSTREETGPLSLYFHLPFCETLCWFCGCNTVTTTDHAAADAYIDLIEREVAQMAAIMQPGRQVAQLHFGGGTPNFLTADQIRRLGKIIHGHFRFLPNAECSVELDPRRLHEEQVAAFAEMGVTRGSFGVQDCNPEVQQAIHRVQPSEDNSQAMRWLRKAGFRSVNLDLIYGLPRQTPETFADTLAEVLALEPDRFAVFSYAHVPWIRPAQKILERHALPDADTKLQLLKLIIETLTNAGYTMIGLDHFARPDDELTVAQRSKTLQRNFQGYSTWADTEICAFGISSISQSSNAYRQNVKDLVSYRSLVEAGQFPIERGFVLGQEDQIRRETIMRLMCDLELDYDVMSERLGLSFKEHFAAELAGFGDLESDGLVSVGDHKMVVTGMGRLFIRNIAMRFDAYLKSSGQQYSKTV
ncbi:MAG: oxygen-independent coproporphyrinogen III oxidase [Verrucomicrobiota bacterium]